MSLLNVHRQESLLNQTLDKVLEKNISNLEFSIVKVSNCIFFTFFNKRAFMNGNKRVVTRRVVACRL